MSDSSISLPKSIMDSMVQEKFTSDISKTKTVYNTYFKNSRSHQMQSGDAIREFSNDVSPALKSMAVAVKEAQLGECYKERYVSDNFTNLEQISLCKKEKYDEVFSNFNTMVEKHRHSDVIRAKSCIVDAGQDIMSLQ